MTLYRTTPGLSPPTWVRVLLGAVLIIAGLFVLGDIALATLISAIFIAITAIIAGGFEIVHAYWTKGWGGLAWHVLLGALYIAFGIVLLTQPAANILIITYVLGLLLAISGFVRILLCVGHWNDAGWLMLLSGIFGILAGLVILTGFPMTGLWVLGLLLGIDLVGHGIAWLAYGWLPSAFTAMRSSASRP
ncbi:MAG TPA: HdeD family acid-resistance protein [Pseudolabrys sp.]|nr:HdeD family acid-resistance protein [Pseudolabrys sp.]